MSRTAGEAIRADPAGPVGRGACGSPAGPAVASASVRAGADDEPDAGAAPPAGRLALGAVIFGLGVICPVFVPLVIATSLPPAWKTGLSGALVLGGPELFTLAAAAVLGRSGFVYLQGRLFALLRRAAPPDHVSPLRYRVGLVMFSLPLLEAWLVPYLLPFLPGYADHVLWAHVAGDVMFVASIFVLGGEFWDKLRALFVHRAVVRFG